MPRLVHRTPSYRKHRASGRAIVTLDGQDIYLGTFGTQPSRDEYDRVIKEWMANGRRLPAGNGSSDLTIAEMLLAFWAHAQTYYRRPDGTPMSEVSNYADVIRVFRKLYGRTTAADFGPLALKALREKMIELGWCRTNINRQIGRVKHIFKWACENELVPPAKYEGLRTVSGLKAGRSAATESEPVQPVPTANVEAILNHVSRQVSAMIRLQEMAGIVLHKSSRSRDAFAATGKSGRINPGFAGRHYLKSAEESAGADALDTATTKLRDVLEEQAERLANAK